MRSPTLPRSDWRSRHLVFADVVHFHPFADQLPAILVAGDQPALAAEFLRHPGDGCQEVVGLVPLASQRRDAHRVDHPTDGRDLRPEIVGHGRPVLLVCLVHLMPEGRARHVERAKEIVRLLLFQKVQDVACEPIDGPHRLAAGAGEFRQGVKNLVDQRVRIDDIDGFSRQRFRGRFGRPAVDVGHEQIVFFRGRKGTVRSPAFRRFFVRSPAFRRFFAGIPAKAGTTNIGRFGDRICPFADRGR